MVLLPWLRHDIILELNVVSFIVASSWLTFTHLKESSRGNDNHQALCELLDPFLQGLVGFAIANACTTLQCVRHQHAMLGQEFATLDDVMASSADESGADDADYLG